MEAKVLFFKIIKNSYYKNDELKMVSSKLFLLAENQPNTEDNNWNTMPSTSTTVENIESEKLVNNEDKDSACDTLMGGESTSDSSPSTSIFSINVLSTDLNLDSPSNFYNKKTLG